MCRHALLWATTVAQRGHALYSGMLATPSIVFSGEFFRISTISGKRSELPHPWFPQSTLLSLFLHGILHFQQLDRLHLRLLERSSLSESNHSFCPLTSMSSPVVSCALP